MIPSRDKFPVNLCVCAPTLVGGAFFVELRVTAFLFDSRAFSSLLKSFQFNVIPVIDCKRTEVYPFSKIDIAGIISDLQVKW